MTPINVMSGSLGDIFWDLAPWITYEPGYDLGCSIYVANPGDAENLAAFPGGWMSQFPFLLRHPALRRRSIP